MRKVALLIVLVLVLGCKKEQPAATHGFSDGKKPKEKVEQPRGGTERPDVGAAMPAYAADLLGGGTFDVEKERGSVVMLNLWATWCGPCRYEIPELQALHNKYSARGFKVVGVSVDEGGEADVKPFVEEQKITYPIALDPAGKLANIFQSDILPTTVIVDRNGKIIWRKPGVITPNDAGLIKAIEDALG